MTICQPIPSNDAFASNMLGWLDCQASILGSQGWRLLGDDNATGSLWLGALLTIFVAVYGYRLLVGHPLGVRDLVLAVVKVGIVLTLATSWPAYQRLVYDVVMRGPGELAAEIAGGQRIPSTRGELALRLDGVDASFQRLAILGVGQAKTEEQRASATAFPPALFANFDTFALGAARLTWLVGILSSWALVRLAAGLLLALGPIFAALLLFAGTAGLFVGWLRALVGLALGALVTNVLLGFELLLFEPWLAELLARRLGDQPVFGAPAQLWATSIMFGIALAGTIVIVARVAWSLRLPAIGHDWAAPVSHSADASRAQSMSTSFSRPSVDERPRALAIAGAIEAADRRESYATPSRATIVNNHLLTRGEQREAALIEPRLGQSFRRPVNRVSASGRARDLRA